MSSLTAFSSPSLPKNLPFATVKPTCLTRPFIKCLVALPTKSGHVKCSALITFSIKLYFIWPSKTQCLEKVHHGGLYGADGRNRTCNLLITNQLLCLLSYISISYVFIISFIFPFVNTFFKNIFEKIKKFLNKNICTCTPDSPSRTTPLTDPLYSVLFGVTTRSWLFCYLKGIVLLPPCKYYLIKGDLSISQSWIAILNGSHRFWTA